MNRNGILVRSKEYRYYASYILSNFDSKLAAIAGKMLDKSYVKKNKDGYMFVVIGQRVEKSNNIQ
jgi:hypothetical protein